MTEIIKPSSEVTQNFWNFAVDRGGTFTDVIGISSSGEVSALKLMSESPAYEDAVVEGIRRVLGLRQGAPIPLGRVGSIRVGTTVATNALLERKGEPAALFITKGLRDLIEIGHQARPDLFALAIEKPEMLYCEVREVNERIDARGKVIRKMEEKAVRIMLSEVFDSGIRAVAIVLMHSWKNPIHEQVVAGIARELGFVQVSVSHEVMPVIKIVGRGQTSLVDAYLSPVLRKYVDLVRASTGDIRLQFMASAGGLREAEGFTGKDAIISGPAGGVVGCARVARDNGMDQVIGFDMGGTSTDVCRYDGEFERVFENTTGGISFQAPMLNVVTMAAGGGSILWFDGQKLNVGPESAGADPGPACYGRGGPPAVTDANLYLGRLLPEFFPREFGPSADQPLVPEAASKKFREFAARINSELGTSMKPEEVALGFLRIANEKMCRPIKEISVARGFDIRRHGLICFGGAGGQHVCAIAKTLGIGKIIIHPLAGLLSAYGIAGADQLGTASESALFTLDEASFAGADRRMEEMAAPLRKEFLDLGIPEANIRVRKTLDLRPLGSDSSLNIHSEGYPAVVERFHADYERHFGFVPDHVPVEVVTLRVDVSGSAALTEHIRSSPPDRGADYTIKPVRMTTTWFAGGELDTPVYRRDDLTPGFNITGPAIVVEPNSTVLVEPGFSLHMADTGVIVLQAKGTAAEEVGPERDPVMLEVFNHLFMSVAEQMGATLSQTAHSTNIKERLDFSCAIFDSSGNLVANAPHIPVHLGAMGESVRAVFRDRGESMKKGDVYVTNNPHRGGSHLPDVTVISPVFSEAGELIFFTASRGHHADIGGRTPGSMPPEAGHLEEEGVVLDGELLVRDGEFREAFMREILASGKWPARNPDERISDLRSQVAANQTGIRELMALVSKYGLQTVEAYMGHIQDNAVEALGAALGRFVEDKPVFESEFEDFLDDGAAIRVRVSIDRNAGPDGHPLATIDFTGTDPQLDGNLNAPYAVTRSAVLYVFRTLIPRDIPLNEGCHRLLRTIIPEGSLLNPMPGAAVAGGNVETSQRVVDVLYGALGVAAASQGTMNNFLFGRPDGTGKQYYETIGGGSGAVDGHEGASAVQVHMTNTRITDPEVLEQRYPEVMIERFGIRKGSGGPGKYRGGDGTIREVRFLRPRQVTILSERRRYRPWGLEGGRPGKPGVNELVKNDGRVVPLPGRTSFRVEAGETVVIKTPGGGGFGVAED